MTEAEFRARLADLGITLDPEDFAAAWRGAQRLRAEAARIARYLAAE